MTRWALTPQPVTRHLAASPCGAGIAPTSPGMGMLLQWHRHGVSAGHAGRRRACLRWEGMGSVWGNGSADGLVAPAVSPVQSKEFQTEMKTEPSFC